MEKEILPNLFKSEYRKIISVLCKRFGLGKIEVAEDLVSETFLTAAQLWPIKGIPENPVAWLHQVARNKAINYLKRNALFEKKISEELKSCISSEKEEIDLSDKSIKDSQLQMMFAVCHPSISPEAQIGLSLRILCGFGIEEISDAFLVSKETINKRLYRAKEKLRDEKIQIEFPGVSEMDARLDSVLRTIYLLFNEGYYSTSQDSPIRKDLCFEAMRLCYMLAENENTSKPKVNALLSLMCFHASRLEARINQHGDLVLYEEQDTSLWNGELIHKGIYFLKTSATGNQISNYHLEAAIAFWHTQKSDTGEKWEKILQLYNQLLQIEYTPMAALNRAFVLSKTHSREAAIEEAEKLRIEDNHLYFTVLGELYSGIQPEKARRHFEKALALAKTETDKNIIRKKLNHFNK